MGRKFSLIARILGRTGELQVGVTMGGSRRGDKMGRCSKLISSFLKWQSAGSEVPDRKGQGRVAAEVGRIPSAVG